MKGGIMFYLPRVLLQIIKPVKFKIEMVIPTPKRTSEENDPTYLESMVSAAMEEIYNRKTEIPRHIMHRILMAFGEALANACDHGNLNVAKKKVVIICWFGEKGVVFSFRDEGDFFRQKKNKERIESRIPIPTTRTKIKGGDGMSYIYEANKIFISTRKNTLYLLFELQIAEQ